MHHPSAHRVCRIAPGGSSTLALIAFGFPGARSSRARRRADRGRFGGGGARLAPAHLARQALRPRPRPSRAGPARGEGAVRRRYAGGRAPVGQRPPARRPRRSRLLGSLPRSSEGYAGNTVGEYRAKIKLQLDGPVVAEVPGRGALRAGSRQARKLAHVVKQVSGDPQRFECGIRSGLQRGAGHSGDRFLVRYDELDAAIEDL